MNSVSRQPAAAASQHGLPGEPGLWLFIIADMAMFGLFFLLFVLAQAQEPEIFQSSRSQLDPFLGFANTVILICSGWWIARAVDTGRVGDFGLARRQLAIGVLVGLGFAATKLYEYGAKVAAGVSFTANEFFIYYFCLTGIHFIHFLVGIGLLSWSFLKLGPGQSGAPLPWLEGSAAYWHMVDLLWLVLFPMLYLAGGRA